MKSLARNSFYNVVYRCLNVIFPLITMSYVSRVLFASGIGEVASATNIASYFTVLAALGLPTYGTKAIAACTNDSSTNETFWDLIAVNVISTIFFSVAYYTLIFTHPFFKEQMLLFSVVGLAIVFNAINVDWFYQGKEEYGYITLRSFVIKILSLIAIFVFVKTREDVVRYALILTLSNVANYVFNIIHIRKFISWPKQKIDIRSHLKPILLLLSASIIIELYTMVGTTLLTIFSQSESVGYFSNSMTIIRVVRTLVTAVSAVFLPRLSFYYHSGRQSEFEELIDKGLKILLFLTVPAAAGVCLVASDAVLLLFGDSFYGSIISVRILSLSIVTIAISNFIGYQVFITIGKEYLMVYSTIVGATINITLNLLLVNTLDYVGIALASALAELSVAAYQVYYLKKMSLLAMQKIYLMKITGAVIIMMLAIILCQRLCDNLVIRLILSVIIGAITYFASSFLYKIDIANQLITRFVASKFIQHRKS